MSIRVSGVGAYVPDRVLSNAELATKVDTSDAWIVAKTGIRERRLCAAGEAPSDMGYRAALDCLRNAGVDRSEVDLIVVATATPDQPQPGVGCFIQEKLGIARYQAPAFDVNSVCSGFVFALSVAQSMMLASPEQYRNALVVGADAFSRIMNWQDRRTCVFFGDGAGAVLLSHSGNDGRRIRFRLGSDGRGTEAIQVPAGGSRTPVTPEVLEKRLQAFTMDGPKVWDFAVSTVPRVVQGLLAESGMSVSDLDLVILHQSNLRMIETIMGALGLPMDRAVTTVESYGNTAAASIPLTMKKALETGQLHRGSRVMLCGFGGGLSWGAALMDW
jgi:3-oxoacyl-[acyl-carrier-protein] synthase-3